MHRTLDVILLFDCPVTWVMTFVAEDNDNWVLVASWIPSKVFDRQSVSLLVLLQIVRNNNALKY